MTGFTGVPERLVVGSVWAYLAVLLSIPLKNEVGIELPEVYVVSLVAIPLVIVGVYVLGTVAIWVKNTLNLTEGEV